jgi:hypothetical protein
MMSTERIPSVEDQMPRAVVAVPWPLMLPWVVGLLFLYLVMAAIYIVGFTIVFVIAVVQVVRERGQ